MKNTGNLKEITSGAVKLQNWEYYFLDFKKREKIVRIKKQKEIPNFYNEEKKSETVISES